MLNRVWSYYLEEKKYLFMFLLLSLVVTLLDFATPIYIKKLIDISIPNKNLMELSIISSALLLSYLGRYVLGIYSNVKGQLMGNRIKHNMREELFRKIIDQPKIFFLERDKGEIISRVTGDLENVSQLLHRGMEEVLFTGSAILGAMIIMAQFNWKLTVVTLLPLPGAMIFSVVQNGKLKKSYLRIREGVSELTSTLHDILNNIFFVKNYQLEEEKGLRFQNSNIKVLEMENTNIHNSSSLISGINLYNQFTQLVVIFAGGYLHITGEISLGVILSFILLTNRFRVYLMKLLSLVDIYQRGMAGMVRFFEVVDMRDEKDGNLYLEDPIEEIEFRDLTFAFKDKVIFNKFNLKIEAGEKIAFVGRSGIGKSTLLSLLKKELEPTSGEILINGVPLSRLNRKGYLERLGIVDQSNQIFKKDVVENISIIDRTKDEKELLEAMKKSGSDHLAHITEKEIEKLSSGERQRISLARLFFKKPEVILLDEATSVLDNLTEKIVMDNLMGNFQKGIVIGVAHRIKAIKNFHRIIYLDSHGIAESGTYEELIESGGQFSKMCLGES